MCASMIDLKKAMTKITEVEEELKSTRDGYEEEMTILVEKNDDLTRKLGVFMGDPAPVDEDEEPQDISPKPISSSSEPTRKQIVAVMTMLMKLEQISWNLPPIKISR